MRPEDYVRKRCAAYSRVFTSPDGEFILDDLRKKFGRSPIRHGDKAVDPNGTLISVGSREVLLYIEASLENHLRLIKKQEEETDAIA